MQPGLPRPREARAVRRGHQGDDSPRPQPHMRLRRDSEAFECEDSIILPVIVAVVAFITLIAGVFWFGRKIVGASLFEQVSVTSPPPQTPSPRLTRQKKKKKKNV